MLQTINGFRRLNMLCVALFAGGILSPDPLYAQESDGCAWLCKPELKIEPQITIEHLFSPARVEVLGEGVVLETVRQERERVFELILAVGIPTEIPRVSFTFETILVPFGETGDNPFTGVTANQLGRTFIRDNGIGVELELNLAILEPEQTGGWVESHFDIVDKISAAERPDDSSVYTHKLNLELDTALLPFNFLSEDNWLRGVELEASLDFVATGLPRSAEMIGNKRFLDDASPWSLSIVVVVPLAPLSA